MARSLLIVVAALCAAASAGAAPKYGVAEDAPKYADDGGRALFRDFHTIGLTVDRVTVQWDQTNPDVIPERAFLDRLVPAAASSGIELVFQIFPKQPRAFQTDVEERTDEFAAFVKRVAVAFPEVRRFIVLNEPNELYFLSPQLARGRNVSAPVALKALAKSYDALKGVDPGIEVIGLSLSPEANDRTSTSPVRFLAALGRAYRASGRTRPLMDSLGLHLYPKDAARQDETTRYQWPQTGPKDLGRIKQAFHDAFAGTGQPLFQETPEAVGPVASLVLDELGWQVRVLPSLRGLYTARENTTVTTEARQADVYASLVRNLACDQAVSDVLLFHLIDESDLRRFQSGLERVNGARRPSFAAVQAAIRKPPSCAGVAQWHHLKGVAEPRLGARPSVRVSNGGVRVRPSAAEDVTARVSLVRDGDVLSTRSLAVPAYRRPPIFLAAQLSPGSYTIVARLTAVLAPSRVSTISRPLLVR